MVVSETIVRFVCIRCMWTTAWATGTALAIVQHSKKGYQIMHQCQTCDAKRVCKIAEYTQMPDDFDAILKLFERSN